MRRGSIALGIVAILVSSCGRSDPPEAYAELQAQVASIRQAAEAGRPGYALGRLDDLIAMVESRLDQGLIDEGRAIEILESAEAVGAQLSLLPRPSQTEAPSPSPEDEGGDGNPSKDKGKGNGKGNGDEGHGND